MLPARPVDRQILSSTKERTDCISLLATPVVLDDPLPLSRPVSLHKSERDADSKDRWSLPCQFVQMFYGLGTPMS